MRLDDAKAKLRREVLAAREELSAEKRRASGEEISSRIHALPEYRSARTVLAYCGFGSEPETRGLLKDALRDGKRLVLPRVDRPTKSLALHCVEDTDRDLTPGTWGISEPKESLPEVGIESVDFALVPGVAFDREGGRLGYGGGYYDRMLGVATVLPVLVAAAFEVQIVPGVPVTPRDVRIDVLVSEASVVRR